MTALFALLPIFGFATIFNIFCKKNISVSIFLSITAVTTILYIFGMFGFLQLGTYLMFYGGIFLLLLMSIIYSNKIVEIAKTVPFIIFVITSVVYLYLMKDAQFFFWDEYSHWGAFIRYMYSVNTFYDLNTAASHLNYPPGISLWDYFIIMPTGFKEGSVYFAYFLMIFSSTLMMYERLRLKDIHWILLVFIIQTIVYASFGHWFSSIYVDHVVGALFAGLVLSYLSDKYTVKDLFLFIFPLVTIALVKEIGLYFGLAFLGLVLLLRLTISKLKNHKSILFNINLQKKVIGILLLLFIVMAISLKSWSIRQESYGVSSGGQTIIGVVKNLFSDKQILDDKTKDEVEKRFMKVVFHQQVHVEKISLNYNEFSYGIMSKYKKTIKLTTVGSMIFFIFMYLVLFFATKNKIKRVEISLIYAYILFVVIVYLFILYFSFLVAFGADALRIPSYVRYINMGILPMFLIGFAVMLPMFNRPFQIKDKTKDNINLWYIALTIIFILGFITRPYLKPMYSQLHNRFRVSIDKISPIILKNVPAKAKLFVIFPFRNNGSLNNIVRYSLIPINSTISKYDFEKKSFQEMLNIYSKYDYIWFVQLNNMLIKKNRAFLRAKVGNQAYMLYRIDIKNNNIKFIPII